MLSPERIERLRGYLLEQRAALKHQLEGLEHEAQESNVGLGNHMAEDATAAFDQAAGMCLRKGHERSLKQVESALHRMADASYGRCERCNAEIDFARLKAVPEATLCMNCQRLAELHT
jgi:RNA polymerase-binding protein DksA